jgi:hypothetical protein
VKASYFDSLATRPLSIQRSPPRFNFRHTRARAVVGKKPLMSSVVVAEDVKGFLV